MQLNVASLSSVGHLDAIQEVSKSYRKLLHAGLLLMPLSGTFPLLSCRGENEYGYSELNPCTISYTSSPI